MQKLKIAFAGLMARDPDDPQSYYQLAGLHWLPGPDVHCRHHENAYNPWHRAYLLKFEDALRSVEGCEDVTLPYWNIQSRTPDNNFRTRDRGQVVGIPDVLFEPPFADYTLPRTLRNLNETAVYEGGSLTSRRDEAAILCLLASRGVHRVIDHALTQSHWEQFNGWDQGTTQAGIIQAHDSGHVACGETLSNQDVAAFDPMFWFFHANWDRLWWKWQQRYGATTLASFKTHLGGSSDWLEDPVLNGLSPFDLRTKDTIDLAALGVDYDAPLEETPLAPAAAAFGSMPASARIEIADSELVSLRIKGVDRLAIPGSFDVTLTAGGFVVGRQSFFQSTTPKLCETCRRNAHVDFDFVVDLADLGQGPIEAYVDRLAPRGRIAPVPLNDCGAPTINVRTLLREY